jgi:ankyrin repeat protein
MKEKGLTETEVMNVKSPSGMTALDIAVLTGNAEMVQLLVSKGGELGLLKGPKQKQGQESAQGEDLEELERRSSIFNARARGNSAARSSRDSEISEKETKEDSSEKSAQDELRAREIAESEIALKLSEERIAKEANKMVMADKALKAKESEEYYEQKSKFKSEQESAEKLAKEKVEVAGRTQSSNAELAKILGISLSDSTAEISLDKLLFHAVDQNKNNLAKIIVSLGGNPNHQENGVSVLSRAVERGDESLVSRLYASASPETRKISEVACGENPKMREFLSNLSRSEVLVNREEKSVEVLDIPAVPRVEFANPDRTSAFSSLSNLPPRIPAAFEGEKNLLDKTRYISSISPDPRPRSPISVMQFHENFKQIS